MDPQGTQTAARGDPVPADGGDLGGDDFDGGDLEPRLGVWVAASLGFMFVRHGLSSVLAMGFERVFLGGTATFPTPLESGVLTRPALSGRDRPALLGRPPPMLLDLERPALLGLIPADPGRGTICAWGFGV